MPTSFEEKVYGLLLKIPKGKVTTYKAVAQKLNTKAYRAVGNALNKNKQPDKYPCFKVINSDGSIGNYALGKEEKMKRLKEEGILIKNNKVSKEQVHFFLKL